MKITRRDAIRIAAASAAFEPQGVAQQAGGLPINWLDKTAPGTETGVSWGVPWARGTVRREQKFALTSANGKSLPLQQWPLAYWPDGSIKFLGFATVTGDPGPFRLAPGVPQAGNLKVETTEQGIEINTGQLRCRVGPSSLIDAMTIDGRVVARDGKLVCILDNGTEFTSQIQKVTVEDPGPVRVAVKVEGVHKNASREWLPFVVRLYFYSGQVAVRLVHTIVFDGDHETRFHQRARPRLRRADARAGTQSPRAFFRRGRRALVRTRAAADRAPYAAGQSLPRPTRRQAHREQRNIQRGRPEAHQRLGGVGRFQTRADHGRRVHHPEAHQPGELLAGRDRRTPVERAGVRRRCIGRARRGSEELLAVVPGIARSPPRDRTPPPNCTCGSGRPKRPRWICGTTTRAPTIWIPATRMCSPASAHRTVWPAPAK